MASASAFGFSGWDPVGTLGDASINGWLGTYFGNKADKKSAKRQLQNQVGYSTWSAQNLPSLQVEGLRKAGLNPILAVDSLSGAGGGSVGSGGNAFVNLHGSSAFGFDRQAFEDAKRARRMADANVREQESIADRAEEDVRARQLENENLELQKDNIRSQTALNNASAQSAAASARATEQSRSFVGGILHDAETWSSRAIDGITTDKGKYDREAFKREFGREPSSSGRVPYKQRRAELLKERQRNRSRMLNLITR